MKIKIIIAFLLALIPSVLSAQSARMNTEPRLVVNIVVGGMRYDYLERFGDQMSEDGIKALIRSGVSFTAARYDYAPLNSPASLATLTTGTTPSVHGVVGHKWQDVLSGATVTLIDDPTVEGLNCSTGECRYSNVNLSAPTLGDRLLGERPISRVVSVAVDPASAVVMAGLDGQAYWVDASTMNWVTSTKYVPYLPGWVVKYNDGQSVGRFDMLNYEWEPSLSANSYVNNNYSVFNLREGSRFRRVPAMEDDTPSGMSFRFARVLATPLSCTMMTDFARQVIVNEGLGEDAETDILNVCFDALREVGMRYGPESVEAEDMFYRTDAAVASLVRFIRERHPRGDVLFVLTSDHGVSDSYDAGAQALPRHSIDQFKAIVNSFLCSQFGGENWVSGYYNHRLYINRREAFNLKVSLGEAQRRAADFAMQFRGVANIATSSALQQGAFSDSALALISNGFYPKRSGDLIVNLMPYWTQESSTVRAQTGSPYDYDTHVPFVVAGCGLAPAVVESDVRMSSVAVTLARMLGLSRPDAATAEPIEELLSR